MRAVKGGRRLQLAYVEQEGVALVMLRLGRLHVVMSSAMTSLTRGFDLAPGTLTDKHITASPDLASDLLKIQV